MVDLTLVDCYANLCVAIIKNAYQDIGLKAQFDERLSKLKNPTDGQKYRCSKKFADDALRFLESDYCAEMIDFLKWYNSIRNSKPKDKGAKIK